MTKGGNDKIKNNSLSNQQKKPKSQINPSNSQVKGQNQSTSTHNKNNPQNQIKQNPNPKPVQNQNRPSTVKKADPKHFNLLENQERVQWIESRKNESPQLFDAKTIFGLTSEKIALIKSPPQVSNTPAQNNQSQQNKLKKKTQNNATPPIKSSKTKLDEVLEVLNEAMIEVSQDNLEAALSKLSNTELASIAEKYQNETISKDYKLCFLSYELSKIEDDLFHVQNSQNQKEANSQGISFEEFRNKLNDIERNQIANFERLQLAERNPATAEFKSKILTAEELKQVLGEGTTLSAQQYDILLLIEDLLKTGKSRSKVKAALDTGEGKSFLAKKLAEYQKVMLARKNQDEKNFEIVNVDLANQDDLLKVGLNQGEQNSLQSKIYLIDEFHFFKDQNKKILRDLVDKGAKIVIFGASENYYKLAEDVEKNKAKKSSEEKSDNVQQNLGSVEEQIKAKRDEIKKKQEDLKNSAKNSDDQKKLQSELKEANQDLLYIQYLISSYKSELIKTEPANKKYIAVSVFGGKGYDEFLKKNKEYFSEDNRQVLEKILQDVEDLKMGKKDEKGAMKKEGKINIHKEELSVKHARNGTRLYLSDATKEYLESLKEDLESKAKEIDTQIKAKQDEINAIANLNPDQIKTEITNLRSEIQTLKEKAKNSNSVLETKSSSKERDLENIQKRREITLEKIKDEERTKITVLGEDQSKDDWDQKIIAQHKVDENPKRRTQEIFPGISLKYDSPENKEALQNKLTKILNQTQKELIIVNVTAADGKQISLVAKKSPNNKIHFNEAKVGHLSWYKAIADDGEIKNSESINILNGEDKELSKPDLAEIERQIGILEFKSKNKNHETAVEEGNKFAASYKIPKKENVIMIYAGEDFREVVGGDYGEYSLLDSNQDCQNIYLSNSDQVNTDLIKQIFGRNRNDAINGKDLQKNFVVNDQVLTGEIANKNLADLAEKNVQDKDLKERIEHYQLKIERNYCAKDKFSQLQNLLENSDDNFRAKIILGDLAEFEVLKSRNLLKIDNSNTDKYNKFVRDLRLLVFYEAVQNGDLPSSQILTILKDNQSDFKLDLSSIFKNSEEEFLKNPTQEDIKSLIAYLPYLEKSQDGKEKEKAAVERKKIEIEKSKNLGEQAKKSAAKGEIDSKVQEELKKEKAETEKKTLEQQELERKKLDEALKARNLQEENEKKEELEKEQAKRTKELEEKQRLINEKTEEERQKIALTLEDLEKRIADLQKQLEALNSNSQSSAEDKAKINAEIADLTNQVAEEKKKNPTSSQNRKQEQERRNIENDKNRFNKEPSNSSQNNNLNQNQEPENNQESNKKEIEADKDLVNNSNNDSKQEGLNNNSNSIDQNSDQNAARDEAAKANNGNSSIATLAKDLVSNWTGEENLKKIAQKQVDKKDQNSQSPNPNYKDVENNENANQQLENFTNSVGNEPYEPSKLVSNDANSVIANAKKAIQATDDNQSTNESDSNPTSNLNSTDQKNQKPNANSSASDLAEKNLVKDLAEKISLAAIQEVQTNVINNGTNSPSKQNISQNQNLSQLNSAISNQDKTTIVDSNKANNVSNLTEVQNSLQNQNKRSSEGLFTQDNANQNKRHKKNYNEGNLVSFESELWEKIENPATVVKAKSLQALSSAYTLYKPNSFYEDEIWDKNKERGNNLFVLNDAYQNQVAIENFLRLSILVSAKHFHITNEGLRDIILIAKTKGGVSSEYKGNGRYSNNEETQDNPIARQLSAMVQSINESLGILSPNSGKGLRLTHVPLNVIHSIVESKGLEVDEKSAESLKNQIQKVEEVMKGIRNNKGNERQ